MCPIPGKLAYLDVENFGDEQSLTVEVHEEIFKLNGMVIFTDNAPWISNGLTLRSIPRVYRGVQPI
jgi:hypothetical protein